MRKIETDSSDQAECQKFFRDLLDNFTISHKFVANNEFYNEEMVKLEQGGIIDQNMKLSSAHK